MNTGSIFFRHAVLALILFLLGTVRAAAHAGDGIVADRQGNIYYTDLEHVWRRNADGSLEIVVKDVHTHQLFLDDAGNLYGENLWYEGEATDRWRHYVWRRDPSGKLEKLFEGEGLLSGYGFVRDKHGAMYWADGSNVMRQSADGVVDLVATLGGKVVSSLAVAEDGRLFLAAGGRLFSAMPGGEVQLLADRLADGSNGLPRVEPIHEILGLKASEHGVYVAAFGDRAIKHVGLDGEVETIVTTRLPWSPSGLTIGSDGRLWLLEYSLTNSARVRPADGGQPIDLPIVILAAFSILLVLLCARKIWQAKRSN